ncbi:LysR family transcriptional regulator [Bordetella genomosp. 4]|uniref:LysR family transcriptional regulator n=1 Tax=Bordetella genomosp. 4 TaxID=463044 RepID=A0A261U8Y0_9BORD|nr:LysR family transcriptional regulator [Bordetella genomosp. 4]OZI51456.1 LysR family transcriptional regulator [Bordetella genomosp. 4]OZI57710.1 LysR family transcriptional regulator [Bordetella genomosp. 4]
MELRQLEAFAAVMSTGSVTAAGRLLGRSQPVITRSIQELEAEVGYALFARNGPRVTPTEQGFLLYDDVERALVGLKQIRQRAEEIARGDDRPLRLAATSALATGLLPAALKSIEGRIETSRVQLRSMSPERVLHDVLTGAAQLGATSLPLEHRGLTVHWIGQVPCIVALPANDPLAAQTSLSIDDLMGRRLITMANPYRLRRRLDQALANQGRRAPGLIETNSSVNALAAVRAGLGLAVLEPITVYGLPVDGVAIRTLDIDIPFFFGVITPQSQPSLPAVQAVADALAETAAQLLPGFVRHEASEHGALLHSIYGETTPVMDSSAS